MSILVPTKRSNNVAWPNFNTFEQHLDRIFNGSLDQSGGPATSWAPAVDIHETDDAYVIEADLPGLTKDDIDVKVMEDRVTIRGTRTREEKQEGKGYWRTERASGTFERNFRLHGGIDGSKVEAQFENGVLTIKLAKPEETKPRQIEVKIK